MDVSPEEHSTMPVETEVHCDYITARVPEHHTLQWSPAGWRYSWTPCLGPTVHDLAPETLYYLRIIGPHPTEVQSVTTLSRKEEIVRLRGSIRTLKSELQEERSRLSPEDASELYAALDKRVKEIGRLKQRLEELQAKYDKEKAVPKETARTKRVQQTLSGTVRQLQAKVQTLEKTLARCKEARAADAKTNAELTKERETLVTEIRAIQTHVAELTEERDALSNKNREVAARARGLLNELQTLRATKEKAARLQQQEFDQRMGDLSDRCYEAEEYARELDDELSKLRAADKSIGPLRVTVTRQTREISALKENLAQRERAFEELSTKYDGLEDQLHHARLAAKTLDAAHAAATQKICEVTAELEHRHNAELEAVKTRMREEHARDLDQFAEVNKTLQTQLESSREATNQLSHTYLNVAETYNRWVLSIESLLGLSPSATMPKARDTILSHLKQEQKTRATSSSVIQLLQAENQTLRDKVRDLHNTVRHQHAITLQCALQDERRHRLDRKAAVDAVLEQTAEQKGRFQTVTRNLEVRCEALEYTVRQVTDEREELARELHELLTSRRALDEELRAASLELQERIARENDSECAQEVRAQQVATLESKLKRARAEARTQDLTHADERMSLLEQVEQRDSTIIELEAKLEQSEARVETLEKEVVEQLEVEMEMRDQTAALLTEVESQLEVEMEERDHTAELLMENKHSWTARDAAVQDRVAALAPEEHTGDTVTQLRTRVTRLLEQLEESRRDYANYQAQTFRLVQQMASAHAQLEDSVPADQYGRVARVLIALRHALHIYVPHDDPMPFTGAFITSLTEHRRAGPPEESPTAQQVMFQGKLCAGMLNAQDDVLSCTSEDNVVPVTINALHNLGLTLLQPYPEHVRARYIMLWCRLLNM